MTVTSVVKRIAKFVAIWVLVVIGYSICYGQSTLVQRFKEIALQNIRLVAASASAGAMTLPAATDTIVGKATTDVLTNKTLNAESTGNVLTLPFNLDVPMANCSTSDGAWSNWDGVTFGDNVNSEATYQCDVNTESNIGSLLFRNSGTSALYRAYNHFQLPADWTGAIDLRLLWAEVATTGNVVWQVQTACYAAGGNFTATTWNTAQTVTTAVTGTNYRTIYSAIPSITTTGCSAGNLFKYRIIRDPANAGDTAADTAYLLGVEWTYRRAM